MAHPISGPISPDELKSLADLPYGQATIELRKHDPLYGVKPGQKIEWIVRVSCETKMEGYVTVKADSEEEAIRKAERVPASTIDWNFSGYDDEEVEACHAEPKK